MPGADSMAAEARAAAEAISAVHCVMRGRTIRFDEAGKVIMGKRSTCDGRLHADDCELRQRRRSEC